MDAVPIVPPLFQGTKNTTLTSYKQTTDHELRTDPPVAIDEGMDLIHAMMRCCDGHDPKACLPVCCCEAMFEVVHECLDHAWRRRHVPTNGNILFRR
jgi:hypothetical protein